MSSRREHARKRHYKRALERIVEASDGESAATLKAIAREALALSAAKLHGPDDQEATMQNDPAEKIRYYLSDEFDDNSEAFDALDALVSERDRYREALREIADNPYGDTDLSFVRGIARKALS